MNRLEQIRDRLIAFYEGRATAPLPPCDCVYLLKIAKSAKLPDEQDIDSLVWCQNFIGRIQKAIEGG